MSQALFFNFDVKKDNNTIKVDRDFNAPLDLVWSAWTEADILDQWWAPKPYQCITKSLDFKVGGYWLYYMKGPEGDIHWCKFDYEAIEPMKNYAGIDAFCDENAVINNTKPRVRWRAEFEATNQGTRVSMDLHFNTLEDLEAIIQMGFKEGFTAGLENLDQYIAAQFYLRKQKKTSHQPRVSTYVNFPGNTEVAFNFYKSVFKTEFVQGIQKFGEIAQGPGQPVVAEEIKDMVLHVELPLLGDHILMGTDAPPEMGFTLNRGNNMHINLQPDSREEALRLFNALAEGGTIDMPMQDMFFGAYYGSLTDQFGINWMIHFQNH
ncbi:MAG: SRPBCC domain-containing protein [Saprospiraceae bacterium]